MTKGTKTVQKANSIFTVYNFPVHSFSSFVYSKKQESIYGQFYGITMTLDNMPIFTNLP
jgi:hypothetical protein